MKKAAVFVMILTMLLCSMSYAADEIRFNGMEWGINPQELAQQLPSAETYIQMGPTERETVAYPSKTAERLLDSSKNVIMYNPEFFSEHNVALASGGMFLFGEKPKVAGYDLMAVEMLFSYDFDGKEISHDESRAHFCCAEYTFDVIGGTEAYNVLHDKLSQLYGEGKIQTNQEPRMSFVDNKIVEYTNNVTICTFDGANGTHVEIEFVNTVLKDNSESANTLSIIYWIDKYEKDMKDMDKLLSMRELENKKTEEKNIDLNDFGGL